MFSNRLFTIAIFAQALFCAGAEPILIARNDLKVEVSCEAPSTVSSLDDLKVKVIVENVGDKDLHIFKSTNVLGGTEKVPGPDIFHIEVDGEPAKHKGKKVKQGNPQIVAEKAGANDLVTIKSKKEITMTIKDIQKSYTIPTDDEKAMTLTIKAKGAMYNMVNKKADPIDVTYGSCTVKVGGSSSEGDSDTTEKSGEHSDETGDTSFASNEDGGEEGGEGDGNGDKGKGKGKGKKGGKGNNDNNE